MIQLKKIFNAVKTKLVKLMGAKSIYEPKADELYWVKVPSQDASYQVKALDLYKLTNGDTKDLNEQQLLDVLQSGKLRYDAVMLWNSKPSRPNP